MTDKKDRRCENCTRHNINCFEHRPNKHATECDKWSEKPQKPLKCKFCNSKGLTAIGNGAKGLMECPSCKGSGILQYIKIKDAEGFLL